VAKRLSVRTTDPINIKEPATLRGMVLSIIIQSIRASARYARAVGR